MVGHLEAAWAEDIVVRTEGLERGRPGGQRVKVTETTGGVVYDSAGIRVRAIPVVHGKWTHAFAYRIDTPDRSIVLGGDTAPSRALEEAARGVDLLVHEVYDSKRVAPENRPGGEQWPQYLREYHTSDEELGALAARARPKQLILDARPEDGRHDGGGRGRRSARRVQRSARGGEGPGQVLAGG